MLKIEISKRSAKFLSKLDRKHATQLATKIQLLRLNPMPHDSKTLKGYSPLMRVDAGEYRIIYFVQNEILKITLVGKRNDSDVYKKLKRL